MNVGAVHNHASGIIVCVDVIISCAKLYMYSIGLALYVLYMYSICRGCAMLLDVSRGRAAYI